MMWIEEIPPRSGLKKFRHLGSWSCLGTCLVMSEDLDLEDILIGFLWEEAGGT